MTTTANPNRRLNPCKQWTKKIKLLNNTLLAEKEKINSAASRLQICDNYGKEYCQQATSP